MKQKRSDVVAKPAAPRKRRRASSTRRPRLVLTCPLGRAQAFRPAWSLELERWR